MDKETWVNFTLNKFDCFVCGEPISQVFIPIHCNKARFEFVQENAAGDFGFENYHGRYDLISNLRLFTPPKGAIVHNDTFKFFNDCFDPIFLDTQR